MTLASRRTLINTNTDHETVKRGRISMSHTIRPRRLLLLTAFLCLTLLALSAPAQPAADASKGAPIPVRFVVVTSAMFTARPSPNCAPRCY
jgi:hypothetical protein